MPGKILIEVAAFTPAASLAAAKAGADRIELCSGYAEGGLSPSAGTINLVAGKAGIPVHVMIRPRIGNFLYGLAERQSMKLEIEYCRTMGVSGVVIGALTPAATIDKDLTRRMVEWASPMSVTFHRAFDLCRNLPAALNDLIDCGVGRVLTSGGEMNAILGIDAITGLVNQAAGRIKIIAGGGVNLNNAVDLVRTTGVAEIHLSAKVLVHSKMRQKDPFISFTSSGEVSDNDWFETNPRVIKNLRKLF